MRKRELDRLARAIRRHMAEAGITSLSVDKALLLAEMGGEPEKLRGVLESYANEPGFDESKATVIEIYKRFCGGVQ